MWYYMTYIHCNIAYKIKIKLKIDKYDNTHYR